MLAIIIVNWNGKADTLGCLRSLKWAQSSISNIIVVDNGSTDGSVAAFRNEFAEVKVLEAGKNLGFTGGNNLGIQIALADGAEYVLLLNNDTEIEPNAIAEMVTAADHNPNYGLFVPVILYHDRKEEAWFAGSRIDLSRGEAVHDNTCVPAINDSVRTIPWATGCAMLLRRTILEQVVGFDDRFFLNWEDVDLSVRITRLGSLIGLVPSARIYHKVGRSFSTTWGTGTYYYVRNQLLLVSLHAPRKYRVYLRVVREHICRALRDLRHREPRSAKSALIVSRAILDFVCGRFGPIRKSDVPS